MRSFAPSLGACLVAALGCGTPSSPDVGHVAGGDLLYRVSFSIAPAVSDLVQVGVRVAYPSHVMAQAPESGRLCRALQRFGSTSWFFEESGALHFRLAAGPLGSVSVTTGPLFECTFRASSAPQSGEFGATVEYATGGIENPSPLDQLPFVSATDVRELESPPASSTTTSLPLGEQYSVYDITFGVTTASGDVAALGFDVQYVGDRGEFAGRGAMHRCRWHVDGISECNAKGLGRLSCAYIDLIGFGTPEQSLLTCEFRSADAPTVESFSVEANDATGSELWRLVPLPEMAATQVLRLR